MPNPITRVVKVGGSLLDLPDLGQRIQAWLDAQPSARNILVAGGGEQVDAIRDQLAFNPLDDATAHWKCVEIMNDIAHRLANCLAGARLFDDPAVFDDDCPLCVFAPLAWLTVFESLYPGTNLPESWDVTSDSIAARLAISMDADELVLLKSSDPPSRDLQKLADEGYIDKFLPRLAGELPPLRIVNLREFSCDASHRG